MRHNSYYYWCSIIVAYNKKHFFSHLRKACRCLAHPYGYLFHCRILWVLKYIIMYDRQSAGWGGRLHSRHLSYYKPQHDDDDAVMVKCAWVELSALHWTPKANCWWLIDCGAARLVYGRRGVSINALPVQPNPLIIYYASEVYRMCVHNQHVACSCAHDLLNAKYDIYNNIVYIYIILCEFLVHLSVVYTRWLSSTAQTNRWCWW